MELLSTEYIRYTYRIRVHCARRSCISSRSVSDESDEIEGGGGGAEVGRNKRSMQSDRRKYARRTLHRIKRLRISLAPLRDTIAAIVSTEIGRNLKIRRVKVTFKQFCDERRMDDESKYQLRLKFISLSLSY